MQVSEFKAWFEGFTEDMGTPHQTKLPTVKQWLRIKARIDEIDGVATTERIFHDHYWRRYEPFWISTTPFIPTTWTGTSTTMTGIQNASQAFTALGKAEAASVNAS